MYVDFLGKGWHFPVVAEREGIAMAAAEESIYQSIWIILTTAPGERVMRPDFGCGIHHLVFSINDIDTRTRVEQEVRLAIVRWEPRVEVLTVNVETKGRGEVLLINIRYRIRSTNNYFNLVFPFYLETTAE